MAQGTRDPGHRGARRVGRVRAPRGARAAAIASLGLPEAPAFTHAMGELYGVEVMVCRTGYTGEEGVELMCPAEDAVELWDAIVANGTTPCGLGARDTLRLEVCYPLHGNDITPDTDAISAGLGWTCDLDEGLHRRGRAAPGQGRGAAAQAHRVRDGREGRPPPGHADRGRRRGDVGHALADARPGIGMGYVPAREAAPGTELVVDVRGRPRARARRQEADLRQGGQLSGRLPRAIPTISGTTRSTTGPASRATRPCSGSRGARRTRSASSSTSRLRRSAARP